MSKDGLAGQSQDGTYAIFTGSGVRVDLVSFFQSDSGKKALKDVADSAKRATAHRLKDRRHAR